jgi:hypothetical protein
VKTYRRHTCNTGHRRFSAFAKCAWPRAEWVHGEGKFATVSYCHVTTVTLHPSAARALAALEFIDRLGCGGFCEKRHAVVVLSLPGGVQ